MSKQKDWDTILITWFYNHPNLRMAAASFEYKKIHGVFPDEEVDKLFRVANLPWMNRLTVCRFVVACLPRIASVLWKHKKNESQKIIDTLQKSKIDTEARTAELSKTTKEKTMFDRSAKDYQIGRQMYQIYRDGIENEKTAMSRAGIKRKMARG